MKDLLNKSFIDNIRRRIAGKFKYTASQLLLKYIKTSAASLAIGVALITLGTLCEYYKVTFGIDIELLVAIISILSIFTLLFLIETIVTYLNIKNIHNYQDNDYKDLYEYCEKYRYLNSLEGTDKIKNIAILTIEESEELLNIDLNDEQVKYMKSLMSKNHTLTYDDVLVIEELSIEKKQMEIEENMKEFTSRYKVQNKKLMNNISQNENEIALQNINQLL